MANWICRGCGCSAESACIEDHGDSHEACAWVELDGQAIDVCSFCVDEGFDLEVMAWPPGEGPAYRDQRGGPLLYGPGGDPIVY